MMSDATLRQGSVHIERATGAGSVSGVPELPDGFAKTFESRYIDVDGLRPHAVIGGEGPPLLLVCGWPQTWYAWRYVMPRLAQQFTAERMVQGREEIYFGHQFASKAGSPNAIPDYAVDVYVDAVKNSEALRASFEYYRAIDVNMERNKERVKTRLPMPILAVGASHALGEYVETTARLIADNVAGLVIANCGHFIPEKAPGAFLEAIEPFLRPLDSL
jgi:pimeloyl-ACP methyl ester carboxylesterase